MSLFDLLVSKIAPHDCLVCGAEGGLLCVPCASGLPAVPERCYNCHAPSAAWRTCAACRPTSLLKQVRVATVYNGPAKDLILKLKLSGARAGARIMARRLAPLVDAANAVIVPAPTVAGRARQRGYDQAKLLARELARCTGLPYRDCLIRRGQGHQHGLSRHQRLAGLSGSFYVAKPRTVRGARTILVDDVVTTGATLEAAAAALAEAGAVQIGAVIFAAP